jgi:hypothetical protein
MAGPLKAHQTTIRFTHDQWAELERAAARREVSVAQYLREAARERVERDAGAHEEDPRSETLRAGLEDAAENSLRIAEGSAALWQQGHLARERAREFRGRTGEHDVTEGADRERRLAPSQSASGLWEQGRVARERARMLREEARRSASQRPALARLPRDASAVEDARRVVRRPVE